MIWSFGVSCLTNVHFVLNDSPSRTALGDSI
uniref:Uncharacterized protein n=1 Tax=Arundo donax TaxID=35708 RepID=A0A0A9BM75_ARUDO